MKMYQHENLAYESFITQKFPDLWYFNLKKANFTIMIYHVTFQILC